MINTLFKSAHTFQCLSCNNILGVHGHFVKMKCPSCDSEVKLLGEGFLAYNQETEQKIVQPQEESKTVNDDIQKYPIMMTANHVAEVMQISLRVAYEIMDRNDFPLIRINRHKKVNRDSFFEWLNSKSKKVL